MTAHNGVIGKDQDAYNNVVNASPPSAFNP